MLVPRNYRKHVQNALKSSAWIISCKLCQLSSLFQLVNTEDFAMFWIWSGKINLIYSSWNGTTGLLVSSCNCPGDTLEMAVCNCRWTCDWILGRPWNFKIWQDISCLHNVETLPRRNHPLKFNVNQCDKIFLTNANSTKTRKSTASIATSRFFQVMNRLEEKCLNWDLLSAFFLRQPIDFYSEFHRLIMNLKESKLSYEV